MYWLIYHCIWFQQFQTKYKIIDFHMFLELSLNNIHPYIHHSTCSSKQPWTIPITFIEAVGLTLTNLAQPRRLFHRFTVSEWTEIWQSWGATSCNRWLSATPLVQPKDGSQMETQQKIIYNLRPKDFISNTWQNEREEVALGYHLVRNPAEKIRQTKNWQPHNQSLNLPGLQHISSMKSHVGDDAPTIGITCHLLGSHSFHCTTDFLPILSIACQISTWVVIGWTLNNFSHKSTQSKRSRILNAPIQETSQNMFIYVHIFSRFLNRMK